MRNRPWLQLIIFCVTHVVAAAFAFAIVFAGVTLAFAVGQNANGPASGLEFQDNVAIVRTFGGVITDSDCSARHVRASKQSPAQCTRYCVRNGAKNILVDGDKAYGLHGRAAELEELAGQRVSVVGTLNGNSIEVSSVAPQQ